MALVSLAVDDDGYRTGNTKNCKVPFLQVLYEVWKNMVGDGVITLVRGLTQEEKRIPNNKNISLDGFSAYINS